VFEILSSSHIRSKVDVWRFDSSLPFEYNLEATNMDTHGRPMALVPLVYIGEKPKKIETQEAFEG
jgi:hypothetical protein